MDKLKPITAAVSRVAAALRGLARDARGTAVVEMALVSAPLLMFLFGIMATGHAVWLQNALNASVAEAARCASVNPTLCGTTSQIQSYAAGQTGAGFRSSVFAVTKVSCGNKVSGS